MFYLFTTQPHFQVFQGQAQNWKSLNYFEKLFFNQQLDVSEKVPPGAPAQVGKVYRAGAG